MSNDRAFICFVFGIDEERARVGTIGSKNERKKTLVPRMKHSCSCESIHTIHTYIAAQIDVVYETKIMCNTINEIRHLNAICIGKNNLERLKIVDSVN
jgi:hypothetical protein